MSLSKSKWIGVVGLVAAVTLTTRYFWTDVAEPNTLRPARPGTKLAVFTADRESSSASASRSELTAGYSWSHRNSQTNGATRADVSVARRAVGSLLNDRSGASVAADLDDARVSRRLAAMVRGNDARPIEVLVRNNQMPGRGDRDAIASVGGQVLRTYETLPYMAVRIPANQVAALSKNANVRFLDINARVYSASASARQTAGVPLSGAGTSYPVSGTMGVAVVDSGVATHPDLNVVERVAFNDARSSFFGNLFDVFNDADYRESDGSDSWTNTPWIESGDDGSAATGKVRIQTGNCPYATWEQCVELSANSTTSTAIERSVLLLGAKSATLNFEYQVKNISSSAAFVLEISNNAGLTWTALKTFSAATAYTTTSVDITPYLNVLTKFRFRVTDTDPTATFTFDWVEVKFSTSTNYLDDFTATAYSNSYGSEAWSNAWVESGETSSASAGKMRVESNLSCPTASNACLRLDASSALNYGVHRSVNLANAFGAVLSFDSRQSSAITTAAFVVEVSKDAGATWTQLDRIDSTRGTFTYYDQRYDLTPYAAADTRIRLRVASSGSAMLRIDNFEVSVDRGNANDALGHGTHIAGIIGGNGGSSGLQPGVARGARIHQVRVLDGRGRGTVADLLAGLDWIYTNGAARGIKVVNMSLGTGVTQSVADDPLVQAVERLWDAGFVVVASAGNYGVFGNMTITSPGISRKIITVGSLTDNGTGTNLTDDYVSTYSSRGPTLIDHVLKPDLIAPGNRYVATENADSRIITTFPLLKYDCGTGCTTTYMQLSGTSMAAAQVSGAVLLMLSQQPQISPSTVKARLMRSARKVSLGDATTVGAGVLNVPAALADTGVVSGQALSPLMARSADGSAIMVEDTALLWGGSAWGAGYLWQNGYLWSNNYTAANGYLWSDGYLWQNGYLWSNGYLWNNGYLWQNGYLWSNGYLWEDAVSGSDNVNTMSAFGYGNMAD